MTYDHQMRHIERRRFPIGNGVTFEQAAVHGGTRPGGRDARPEQVGFLLAPGVLRGIRKLRKHYRAHRRLDTVGAE